MQGTKWKWAAGPGQHNGHDDSIHIDDRHPRLYRVHWINVHLRPQLSHLRYARTLLHNTICLDHILLSYFHAVPYFLLLDLLKVWEYDKLCPAQVVFITR